MKEQISKLCRRLGKFSLDNIVSISELEESQVLIILDELIKSNEITKNNNLYCFNKPKEHKIYTNNLPLKFQYHSKQDIDNIIKGFCTDIEVAKMVNFMGSSAHVIKGFYQYFRTVIYENQKRELESYFEDKPKFGHLREYFDNITVLYLYNHKLYVSEKFLQSSYSQSHTNEERIEIKNIYLRSYRKVLNRSYAKKFHLHLSEEIWKDKKKFNQRYSELKKLLFS